MYFRMSLDIRNTWMNGSHVRDCVTRSLQIKAYVHTYVREGEAGEIFLFAS